MYRLLLITLILVVLLNFKRVCGGSLRSNYVVKDNLQRNLDADGTIVFWLAQSVCYDLEHYNTFYKKFIPFSVEDCQNNFMSSSKNTDKIPPKPQIRREYQSEIEYDIAPIDDPDVFRLLVLTPTNASAIYSDYLPYDLLANNSAELSTVDISSGEYQFWTTLISMDGNHSPWLKGPIVYSWNHTEEKIETYTVQVKTENQVVNESLALEAVPGLRGTIIHSSNHTDEENKIYEAKDVKISHEDVNESLAVKAISGLRGTIVYSSSHTDENKTYAAKDVKTSHPDKNMAVEAIPRLAGQIVHSGNHTSEENKAYTAYGNIKHQVVNKSAAVKGLTGFRELTNHTEDKKTITIQVETEHQVVNKSSAVKAFITWENLDGGDNCFDLINICETESTEIKTRANASVSWEVSGLPMDKDCEVQLIGKYGTTRYSYRTPDCRDLPACVYYEKPHNLSLRAQPGAHGWDVFVGWSFLHQPLFFNVTIKYDNVTRKMQLPGNTAEAVFEDVEGSGYYTVAVVSVLETRAAHTSSRAQFPDAAGWRRVTQALGGAWGAWAAWGALVCAGAAAAAAVLLWRRRRANHLKHIYFPHEPSDKPCKKSGEEADTEALTSEDVSWELRSEKLLLHEVIGEGAFGVVRRGTLGTAGKEVAVKMLKDFPTLDEVRSFRAEIELMKSVGAHPHVVSLIGCCSGRRPFIVAEYCSKGDLLSYLRRSWDAMVSKRNAKYYNNNIESTGYRNELFKCQLQEEQTKLVVNKLYDLQGICDTELTTRDLLSFCRQIAMGMEFLASNRLVHRDLAARNILVSSDRTLKIADFGLSRDVYEENLYKQKGNGKMPMKWMALESLTRRIYTSQSDVWSFGVVMWEVLSVGASPYAGVAAARLPRLLRAGYRMPRPHNCSKPLYEVMSSCWRVPPRARPTFSELHARLDELLLSACARDYLVLQPDAPDDAPPDISAKKYVKIYLKNKLGWSREESYERPLRTAQSNHYSTPPASACKLQPVTP